VGRDEPVDDGIPRQRLDRPRRDYGASIDRPWALSTPCGYSRPTAIGQRILRGKPGAWPGLSVHTVVRLSSDALLLATTQHQKATDEQRQPTGG
jgi:hypothetical protein